MRQVILSGMPRSGTSWTGKVLGLAPGYSYYREPDNSDCVPEMRKEWDWVYRPDAEGLDAYRDHLRLSVRGEIASLFTMKEDLGWLIPRLPPKYHYLANRFPILFVRKPNVIVKLVRGNMFMPWFAEEFPGAKLIYLTRHPMGQFASWGRLGWEPRPDLLVQDEQLVADHLEPHVELIEKAESFWERAGALWGAVTLVNVRQRAKGAPHSIVPFEWLCADAAGRFEELYRRAGLRWTKRTADFLAASDNRSADPTDTYGLARNTEAQIDAWRAKVSNEDIAACRRFAEPFDLPFYRDFDPRAAEPDWSAEMGG